MNDYGPEEGDRLFLPAFVVVVILGGVFASFVACNVIASIIF